MLLSGFMAHQLLFQRVDTFLKYYISPQYSISLCKRINIIHILVQSQKVPELNPRIGYLNEIFIILSWTLFVPQPFNVHVC